MPLPIFAALGQTLLGVLLSLMAVFLILLVLVQRGRGGGLAGALGGMGGSSAFGAKAGDVFTRITMVAATVWIVTCIVAAKWSSAEDSRIKVSPPGSSSGANAGAGAGATSDEQDDASSADKTGASKTGASKTDEANVPDINPSTAP